LKIDLWLKEIAPSNELRKSFGHYTQKWDEFRAKYTNELKEKKDLLSLIKTNRTRKREINSYLCGQRSKT
jgi:uncharacterized protein YeaO (DUF488 family)